MTGAGAGRGEEMVAGLPNASTATGSGASIENVERAFSSVAPLIPLKSVHCVGQNGKLNGVAVVNGGATV